MTHLRDTSTAGQIDAKIASLADWRGGTLARLRALILAADPAIVETVKWREPSNPAAVPVWEKSGVICTSSPAVPTMSIHADRPVAGHLANSVASPAPN